MVSHRAESWIYAGVILIYARSTLDGPRIAEQELGGFACTLVDMHEGAEQDQY